jgi:plasmid stabilization system protein ParE
MRRYAVVFEESAQLDVRESYDWGCRVWGRKEAQHWARQLRTAVSKQLSLVPKGSPLAPENDEFSEEIRQMIVGRYRVLLTIKNARFTCSTLEEPTSEVPLKPCPSNGGS